MRTPGLFLFRDVQRGCAARWRPAIETGFERVDPFGQDMGGRIFGFVDTLGGLFRRRGQSRRSPANLRVYDDNAPRPSTRAASPPPAATPEPVPQPAGGGVDEHLEAKLDAVLAKLDKAKPVNVLFRRGDWAQYAVIRPQR